MDALCAHLNREYCFEIGGKQQGAGTASTLEYPLHPFSARYLSNEGADARLRTWNYRWFETKKNAEEPKSMFHWLLPVQKNEEEAAIIDGDAIYKALSDPIGTFLNACIIADAKGQEMLEDEEKFEVKGLDSWKLRDALKKKLFFGDNDAVERLKADAGLPPGTIGNSCVIEEEINIQMLMEKVNRIQAKSVFGRKKINIPLEGRIFRMDIDLVSSIEGKSILIEACYLNDKENKKKDAKRRLKAWITHLFLNLEEPIETALVSLDVKILFHPLGPENAQKLLKELNEIVHQSRSKLLPFIHDVSWKYYRAGVDNGKPASEAWTALKDYLGLGYKKSYKFNRKYVEAFMDADEWEDAIEVMGEDEFITMAQNIFGPYDENTKEVQ